MDKFLMWKFRLQYFAILESVDAYGEELSTGTLLFFNIYYWKIRLQYLIEPRTARIKIAGSG
jgi:hypothetical protein